MSSSSVRSLGRALNRVRHFRTVFSVHWHSRALAEGCSADRVQEIQALVSRGIIGEAMATGRRVETANAQLDPLLLRAREGE